MSLKNAKRLREELDQEKQQIFKAEKRIKQSQSLLGVQQRNHPGTILCIVLLIGALIVLALITVKYLQPDEVNHVIFMEKTVIQKEFKTEVIERPIQFNDSIDWICAGNDSERLCRKQ